ncbi:hypothetical protein NMQ14_01075 [Methyloversatilis sp. XJ19-13]|uniref:hypothetical protein n=1 Tax=Methyloversatilis sp. XJ19-13 TaxID=2963430 RepID=UPI00211B743C|nr:hypothetical protein [Methyloversatilis sp. XJ19-13]MCQ9372835.1 hypothetical protein [Methyloversatilis sp. XJ19-13]
MKTIDDQQRASATVRSEIQYFQQQAERAGERDEQGARPAGMSESEPETARSARRIRTSVAR